MKLKSIIDSPCGIRFCFESLPLGTGFARRYLLEKWMMITKEDILASYNDLRVYMEKIILPRDKASTIQTLQFKLQGVKDIRVTLTNMLSGGVLDDIALFEVKHLIILSLEVRELLKSLEIETSLVNGLEQALEILDPDGLKIASFYVYDSYSRELAAIRKKIKATDDNKLKEDFLSESYILESEIRKILSKQLMGYYDDLYTSLIALVEIDILLSKAILMDTMSLVFPTISLSTETKIEGMFHPQIKSILEGEGKEFQSIDILFDSTPSIIIGANMGGKTVVLKTVALTQYMFQFGFGVPAKSAKMSIWDEVCLVVGDGQNEIKGISSFAAEVYNIDEIIKKANNSKNILALIDEPARSTNPIEGTALVSALINVLIDKNISLLLTTHYNVVTENATRWRVKGLVDGKMNYELCISPEGEVPHEALNVAESLNISNEWINEAKKILRNNS